MDFQVFFDLYMRPQNTSAPVRRNSVEFRYAAAALLVACARADLNESREEQETIRSLFRDTFGVSDRAIDRMFTFAHSSNEDEYLFEITSLINEQFDPNDKQLLIETLWRVAYADGELATSEENFINLVALKIGLSAEAVQVARQSASET